MPERMHPTLFALFALVLAACGGGGDSCDGACKTADAKYALADRTIRAVDQKSWASEGVKYTLVRVEYGDTEECDGFGEDCGYSHYCGFVVDGADYPVDFYFVTDEDVLFDEDEELTGYDLAVFDDDAFDEWLWETDSGDDILIECFADS